MNITAKTKICMVIGDPIGHSLSPQMHNSAYEKLGIDQEFVYVASRVKIEEIEMFAKAIRVMGIRGVSCTIPHKLEIMKYLDVIDETAEKIGAVNTVVNNDGILTGYNTDWLGVITPLETLTQLKGKKMAVIGAGGAARAMVYGGVTKGADVTIYNRTLENAKKLATDFQCEGKSFENLEEVKDADIILNATSVGMKPHETNSPVPKEFLTKHHIVFDAVYSPIKTQLLTDAENAGAQIIYGTDMLLYQGVAQFKLYTGHEAPVDIMRETLEKYL